MSKTVVVPTGFFVPSFVNVPTQLYARVALDDDFVQAECMRLVRAGREEDALDLLEDWCAQRVRR